MNTSRTCYVSLLLLLASVATAQKFDPAQRNFRRLDSARFGNLSPRTGAKVFSLDKNDPNAVFDDESWTAIGGFTWPDPAKSGSAGIGFSKSPRGLFGTLNADGTPRTAPNLSDAIQSWNASILETWAITSGNSSTTKTSIHADYQFNSDLQPAQVVLNADYSTATGGVNVYFPSLSLASTNVIPNVVVIGTATYQYTTGSSTTNTRGWIADTLAAIKPDDRLLLFTDYTFPSLAGGPSSWQVGAKWTVRSDRITLANKLQTRIDKIIVKVAVATGGTYSAQLTYRF